MPSQSLMKASGGKLQGRACFPPRAFSRGLLSSFQASDGVVFPDLQGCFPFEFWRVDWSCDLASSHGYGHRESVGGTTCDLGSDGKS